MFPWLIQNYIVEEFYRGVFLRTVMKMFLFILETDCQPAPGCQSHGKHQSSLKADIL